MNLLLDDDAYRIVNWIEIGLFNKEANTFEKSMYPKMKACDIFISIFSKTYSTSLNF